MGHYFLDNQYKYSYMISEVKMMEDVVEETVITTTITENNEFKPQIAEV